MVVKREGPDDVHRPVLQRLSDKVKAILLESQSPEVDRTPVGNTSATRRLWQTRNRLSSALHPGRNAMRNERI